MNWRAIVCAVAAAQAVLQGTTADVAAQIFANEPPAMTPNDGVSDFIPAASGSDSSERERAGECLGGGCSNFSVNNPVGTLWTTSSAFITWSTCIHGGDYAFYLVSYGQTYEWSLCPAEGGGGSFDSELSLWDEAGTTPYCYSNDYCGPDARIAWTATLTGVVRVLVSAYPCLSNNICTTLRFRCASCESCIPDFAVTAPGTWSANTCGASNRCDPRPGPEHIYQIVIPTTGVWTFSLCGSTFDTYLYLGTTCCALEMGQNDDSEVCSPQSQLSGWLTAGTYYARIEGHDTSPPNWCGDYTFSVFQCVAACPPGGVPENEPACHTDYDDRTDGGCSWDPQVFWPIANGQTVCGTSGTFLHRAFDNTDPNSAGPYFEFRDTDWYELATTEPMVLTWTAEAEFPVQIRVIDGSCGCALRRTLMSSTVGPCETATLTTECLPPGRYWFWVAPSIFTGVPCGLSYTATLTGVPCALAQPGDMCGNAIPVPGLPYYDTGNTCAYADNYAEACPNVDYTPDVVYAYSPPVNQHITLDLRDSSFDTRLFVYEDACCSPAIACNEGCGTGCPNAAARIECLPVQAGHTYYVVVEGYGGSCGDYVLRVTAARPEIASCPTSRTLPAGPSCQATMPDLTVELVATETCDANLRISQDPPAGGALSPGDTVVTLTATDQDGATDTCFVTITVQDAAAPVITMCASDRTLIADVDGGAALPDLTTEVVVADNCPGVVITQSPAAGTLVGPGETPVLITATDGAGATDSCTVVITVVSQELTLRAGQDCYGIGDSVVVEVWMNNIAAQVVGAQFFLAYDVSKLQLADGVGAIVPGDAPVNVQIFECSPAEQTGEACNREDGTIDYAVGVPFPPVGYFATGNARLAAIHFTALGEACGAAGLVSFRANLPFVTRLSIQDGSVLVVPARPLGPISIDSTPPTIEGCLSSIAQDAEPGLCSAVVTWTDPAAADGCGTSTMIQTAGLPSGSVFPTGTTAIQYTATDSCGNKAYCNFDVTVTDGQTPTITCPPDVAGVPADPGECFATNVPLGLPIYGDNCPGATVHSDAPAQFPVGPTIVTYTVTDAGGLSAECSCTVMITDTEPPAITACPPDRTVVADLQEVAALPDLTAEVLATSNCPDVVTTQSPAAGTLVAPGLTVVTVTVTDGAGLTDSCDVEITVVSQQLALLAGQECYRVGDSVTVEVWMRNIVAQVVGAQFFLEYDAGKLQLNDGVGAVEPGDPPLNVQVFECSTAEQSSGACNPQAGLIDYAVGIPFPPAGADVTGDWKLAVMHFTALSETCGTAGLVTFRANLPFQTRLSTQNGAVLVVPLGPLGPISIDSTSPTIVDCVSGLAQDADPGECSAVVAWPEPTATDDCGTATITQTAGPPSGSAFAVGTTVIQYTAADLCGNESQCVFNVTVTDQQPPAISCPPDIAGFPTDPGQCYATNVPLGVPIYSDNCPGVTVYNDAPPQFPVGPTVVTYTATDAAGHTAQCSVTVTVVDNEPPVIEVCPAERTLTEGDLLPDLTGEVVATDNCGASLALAQDPPAGTVLPLGEHSVLMTVTDGAGLTATCSVTIHVVPQPNGACCLHGNGCQIRTEQACTLAGGIYKGDDVPCTPSPCAHPGDLNCDGSVDFKDINPFVLYLSNFSDWQTTYAGCPPENGDTNGDGTYPSFRDINPFVALLSGGG